MTSVLPEKRRFPHHHLLGIEHLSAEDIWIILGVAEAMREVNQRAIKKVPTLRGKTIINMFLEPSTRTRTSFEIAGKRLSADTYNVGGPTSATVKGETLLDTVMNIQAMRPDAVVLRHRQSGAPDLVARHIEAAVINAGDGTHEHPTQALLDALTIKHAKGRIEGLKVAICGDIAHSRVAKSNALLLGKLGAHVTVFGPRTMIPRGCAEALGVTVAPSLADALADADVVMALRIQKERQETQLFPSEREYAQQFGLTPRSLALAPPDAIVMHPGPINRGVELSPEVADGDRQVILGQVENGVAVRMAVLYLLAGATRDA
jgi:aspartate carbamoyltransferase catalytic subunit